MASNQTTLPNVSENEETLLTGVNENVYEDQSIGAELTKKDINRVAWRSMLLQASFNNVCRLPAGCTACCQH